MLADGAATDAGGKAPREVLRGSQAEWSARADLELWHGR
jgi:hypothetical protein